MMLATSTLIIIVIIILLMMVYVDMDCGSENFEEIDNLDDNLTDNENLDQSPDTEIQVDMNDQGRTIKNVDTRKLQIITAGLGPEVRRLGEFESKLSDMQVKQLINTNMLQKLYKRDVLGDYMTRGWFVQVHDVLSTPHGVSLGSVIDRMYGIRRICFRAQSSFPFVGIPQDPMYLPKAEFVGFRAMTIFKIPKTGYYNFRILSDDGARLMYQVIDSDVMMNEKNVRNPWKVLLDQWRFQSETWNTSSKLYFNQSDLVLLRFDYFQADANSTACIKVRYSETEVDISDADADKFDDFNTGDLYCSLLWNHVPLMGIR